MTGGSKAIQDVRLRYYCQEETPKRTTMRSQSTTQPSIGPEG